MTNNVYIRLCRLETPISLIYIAQRCKAYFLHVLKSKLVKKLREKEIERKEGGGRKYIVSN